MHTPQSLGSPTCGGPAPRHVRALIIHTGTRRLFRVPGSSPDAQGSFTPYIRPGRRTRLPWLKWWRRERAVEYSQLRGLGVRSRRTRGVHRASL